MRLPDDQKRQLILAAAAKMFAAEPYHKVRLDDVATAAGVGKGTIYIYFSGKEDLYFSIIHQGFADLVDRLGEQVGRDGGPTLPRLRRVIEELVGFAFRHPQFFEVMRAVGMPKEPELFVQKRQELFQLVRHTIEDGTARGELADEHPELTAAFIPGLVRSAMLFAPAELNQQTLTDQIFSLLTEGIRRKDGGQ